MSAICMSLLIFASDKIVQQRIVRTLTLSKYLKILNGAFYWF